MLVLATAARAAAQPAGDTSCPACARGDQLIDQLGLRGLRAIAGELAALELSTPLTAAEYAGIVELRRRRPELVRLGAVDNADFTAIAAALCRADLGTCTVATSRALRCLADRCEVAFVSHDPRDPLQPLPEACRDRNRATRSPAFGVAVDFGTGWHRSRYPNDGRAWSLGIEARYRLGRRFGAVARIDRIAGRDAAIDDDSDGNDDAWTGSIARITALAGPSIVLSHNRFKPRWPYLRLDLLGGYLSTRSQADEAGPAAGFDLAYHVAAMRLGVRYVQGFGDARDASILLGHVALGPGAAPPRHDYSDDECIADPELRAGIARARERALARRSRLALGFDFVLFGYGLSSEQGFAVPSPAVELAWYLTPKLHALARADMLVFPRYKRERSLHQAALAGMRFDHGPRRGYSEKPGVFTTVMAGYTHGAGITPSSAGTGPVGDLSFGWGTQDDELAGYVRLHGRFGISPDNAEYRAVFLSAGVEFRIDKRRWRDR